MKIWIFYQYNLTKIWISEKKPILSDDKDRYVLDRNNEGHWAGWDSRHDIYQYLARQFKLHSPLELIEIEL